MIGPEPGPYYSRSSGATFHLKNVERPGEPSGFIWASLSRLQAWAMREKARSWRRVAGAPAAV
jgi:hypothetical protein